MKILNLEQEAQIRANIALAVEIAIRNAPLAQSSGERAEITKIVSSVLGLSDPIESSQVLTSPMSLVAGQHTQCPKPAIKDQ